MNQMLFNPALREMTSKEKFELLLDFVNRVDLDNMTEAEELRNHFEYGYATNNNLVIELAQAMELDADQPEDGKLIADGELGDVFFACFDHLVEQMNDETPTENADDDEDLD